MANCKRLSIFLLPVALFAAGFSIPEKKAIRREMIEMDIAVRNLATIIATGDKKMLDDSLQRIVQWQMKDHPDLGKAFQSALAKWEKNGAIKYGRQVQKEASQLRGYVNARGKFSLDDWSHIQTSFAKILNSCRGCHEMSKKEKL